MGDPIIPGINDCIQRLQGEDDPRFDGDPLENVRETLGFKQGFLNEEVVQLKMANSESVAKHLNEFNTLTSQLETVEINFDDEIRRWFYYPVCQRPGMVL